MVNNRLLNPLKMCGLSIFFFVLSGQFSVAAEDVKIKIIAINPSQTDPLRTNIQHQLPVEIQPEDVLDAAGMEIKYDKENKTFMLNQIVELSPRETKTIVVRVKNVWSITDEDMLTLRGDLENNVKALQGTKYEESSRMLYEKISESLVGIETDQTKKLGIRQQIEMYRAHIKQFEAIQKDISSLASIRKLQDEDGEEVRTVKFVIIAENPTSKPITMRVRSLLPKDITANDVVEKLDFNLLFSEEENRYLVEKESQFEPNEKKSFEIILRDIWYIPKTELDFIKKQSEKLMQHFTQSAYEAFAKQSTDYLNEMIDSIARLQEEIAGSSAIEERIRAFILNSERLELAKKKIKELQDLLLEVPLKRQLNEFDKIREAVKELSKVVDILRLGFTPDLSTTWWIILGIIGFLFILSAIFYVTWLVKLQESAWGKKKSKSTKKASAPDPAAPPAPEPAQAKAA